MQAGQDAVKDASPDMRVRRLLHSRGHRYGLYVLELPGSPDIVFIRRRKVVFINGCFWHGHGCSVAAVWERQALPAWGLPTH